MEAVLAPETCAYEQLSADARRVHQALIENGLETPMVPVAYDDQEKRQRLRRSVTDIMQTLGLDLRDDSLRDTPERIARMYLDELFAGLDYRSFPKVTAIDNKMGADEMVRVDGIELVSTCEHHFITIDGRARVAYIPGARIIGLSKINRIVRFFAQRPQVQERLTRQIMVALQTLLQTEDVAVEIDATHYCVKARGVMDSGSTTRTRAMGGRFRSCADTRAAFCT